MQKSIYVIMGVSGSGKTTIGKLLAEALNVDFLDGDDFHSPENVNKMSAGIALTDEDRYPWLVSIHEKCHDALQNGNGLVFSCSALKKKYRRIIGEGMEDSVIWIYLKGGIDLVRDRMKSRQGHYMPLSLLQSQFDALEEPDDAIHVDISLDKETIINRIMEQIELTSFGIVGMGVMGKSLARNFARNGIVLSLHNRYVEGSEEGVAAKVIADYPELSQAQGFEDLRAFVASIRKPRKILLMINAGKETDHFINEIIPYLEKGDILIDGGNSHYLDTKRRMDDLEKMGIFFVGTGVSGGEKGALEGPAIMPSGTKDAYVMLESYLTKIAAKDVNGQACCTYIGPEGSGHYVKMVHNGIEYAEMQLLAESYAYLRYVLQKTPDEISACFAAWNEGQLSGYLLDITSKLLLKKEGDQWLIDLILDVAGNKGTGNWTTISGSELGQPITVLSSALFARYLSTIKEKMELVKDEMGQINSDNMVTEETLKQAYTLTRLVNHQQGFMLIKSASDNFKWNLSLSELARIWTNGCIIRSHLMEKLTLVLHDQNNLFSNLEIQNQISELKPALKKCCIGALNFNLAFPCHLAALDYLNTLQNDYASANIIQAQRDFFGAHRYRRKDDASGQTYHTEWE